MKKILSALMVVFILCTGVNVNTYAATERGPESDIEKLTGYKTATVIDEGVIENYKTSVRKYASTDEAEWRKYASDYYYSQMSSSEKSLYDSLYSACFGLLVSENDAEYSDFSGTRYYRTGYVTCGADLTSTEIQAVAWIFQMSNPQFYFIGDSIFTAYNNGAKLVGLEVYSDFADGNLRSTYTNKIKTKIDNWVAQIENESGKLDKEKKAHDLIVANTEYDASSKYNQSSASVFLYGKTVCAGYAEAFELLCNAVGIKTVCVTSSTHEWNKVLLYGNWYVVDCTWDDTGYVSYMYFNISDKSIQTGNTDHDEEAFWSDYNVPKCTLDSVEEKEYDQGVTIYNGIDYSAIYNQEYYLENNADLKNAFGNDGNAAIEHFVKYGMGEGRKSSDQFDYLSYRNRYKDLRNAFGNDKRLYYLHYLNYGRFEGRSATGDCAITDGVTVYDGKDYSNIYNYSFYISNNPDIGTAFPNDDIAALAHFVNYGMLEGRQASDEFKLNSYRNRYSDLRSAFGTNWKSYYLHYNDYGKYEGRQANGDVAFVGTTVYDGVDYTEIYDYTYYVTRYPDIKAAFGDDDIATLEHFVKYGMYEMRQGKSNFDVCVYANKYEDLRNAFGTDWKSYYLHYMNYGKNEGRTGTNE